MIDLKDVSKAYPNGVHALNHVNLHIDKGEFVCVAYPQLLGQRQYFQRQLILEVNDNLEIRSQHYVYSMELFCVLKPLH